MAILISEIFTMRYCRRRRSPNPARVASSKRSLFWMIVAFAAACSVLRERAAFVASWGSSERTLLQLCFRSFGIMSGASQSFYVTRMETSGSMTYWVEVSIKLGGRSKTRCRCSLLLVSRCFHDVSSSHSFPIHVATVIRTRHCRLRRSCIEGFSGPVGFKTANCSSLMQCEWWYQRLHDM